MISIDLNGRVALVTGGSRGIGATICTTLAAAGATVVVGYERDRDGAEATRAACGGAATILKADVGSEDACRQIVDEAVARAGRLDLLVNNAAIGDRDSLSMEPGEWSAHWRRTVDVNLLGPVHLSYHAVPHLRRTKGKIINISSRSAFRGETEYFAYAVTKAGLVNWTRCLARALAPEEIRVYAVAPGFIAAGMALDSIAAHGDDIRAQIPSGVIGAPEDVANTVLFLASPLANYLTGSTIDVNGGSYLH
jgi:NAD(P)-dependent dehydrogenase (short-subunit alcohol dehydrogenase family)